MPRINLSVDEDLYTLLKEAAEDEKCTVNVHIISLLEKIYKQENFDYKSAMEILIKEAEEKEINEEFSLSSLPSFSDVSVVKAEKANLKPSIVKARLGKLFNEAVRNEKIFSVKRARNNNEELKFYNRAALYVKKREK